MTKFIYQNAFLLLTCVATNFFPAFGQTLPVTPDKQAQEAARQEVRDKISFQTVDDLTVKAQARANPHLLDEDMTLSQMVTLTPKFYSEKSVAAVLEKASTRRIRDKDKGVFSPEPALFIACRELPTRALMDAWASLHESRWRRISTAEYRLLDPLIFLAILYAPDSAEEAATFAAGEKFFQAFDQLPKDVQDKFMTGENLAIATDDSLNGSLAPISLLPPAAQQAFNDVISASNKDFGQKYNGTQIDSSQSGSYGFRIKPEMTPEFHGYKFYIKHPSGMRMFRVNLPPDGPEMGKGDGAARDKPDTYLAKRREVDLKQTSVPMLEQKVTLDANGVTLTQALTALHEKYGLPFLTNADALSYFKTDKRDIHFSNLTLKKALDKFAELYSTERMKIEWDYRRYGVIALLARGPLRSELPKPTATR